MTDLTKLSSLEYYLDALDSKDREFAQSLLNQFASKGSLSSKQWYWVGELLRRATAPSVLSKAAPTINVEPVKALLHTAAKSLKFPHITLAANVAHGEIELSLAGPKSKNPGAVYVTSPGKFGANVYFGKIDKGQFIPSSACSEADQTVIELLLAKLADDPVKVAREHGKLTGNCCFCRRPLSDPQSTAAGFGPVCAKNFGLKAEYEQAEAIL